MQETAAHYRSIGIILLKDRYGHRLQTIEMDRTVPSPMDKIREIYAKWLQEEPYHSWATLCECFRQCNLHTLAQRIEKYLNIFSLQTSPGIYNN